MNKKGFTLIELLTVLVVIGIIGLITVTSITSLIKNYKNDLYNKQLDNIKSAAMIWGADKDNFYLLPNDSASENICYYNNINECSTNYKKLIIDLHTLQSSGVIDANLKNPKTKEPFENVSIEITKNGNNLEYTVITNNVEYNS